MSGASGKLLACNGEQDHGRSDLSRATCVGPLLIIGTHSQGCVALILVGTIPILGEHTCVKSLTLRSLK